MRGVVVQRRQRDLRPEGQPVARTGADDPAVVVADLDLAEVRRVQDEVNTVARDRRDSLGHRERLEVG